MQIIPAIDLIDGESVRLVQGDYEQQSQMPRTPEEAIFIFVSNVFLSLLIKCIPPV